MRLRLAFGTALCAVAVLAASAASVSPTSTASVAATFTPFALPLDVPRGVGHRESPAPFDALLAPAALTLGEAGIAPIATPPPRRQPTPSAHVLRKVQVVPSARTIAPVATTGHVLRGGASWYCNNDGSRARTSACHYRYPDTAAFNAYAAAGPRLRAALGGGDRWRGRIVLVDGIRVKLVDWCQCYKGQANEKLIDLYYDVFQRTGGRVTIRW